jgi:hypothetical protein
MGAEAFLNWRRELEAIEQEMDRLITQGLPDSNEQRQVRRTRFAALVGRREAAARHLLHGGLERRRGKPPTEKPGSGDNLIAAPGAAESHAPTQGFVRLPEGTRQGEAHNADSIYRPTTAAEIATGACDAAPAADTTAGLPVAGPGDCAECRTVPDPNVHAEPGNVGRDVSATALDLGSLVAGPPPGAAAGTAADRTPAQSLVVARAADTVAPASGADPAGPADGPAHVREPVRSAERMPEKPVSGVPQTLIPGLLELGAELRPNRANPIGSERRTTDAFAAAGEGALRPEFDPLQASRSIDATASAIDEVVVGVDAAAPAFHSGFPRATRAEIAGVPEPAPDISVAAGANIPAESAEPSDDSAGVRSASHFVGAVVSPGDAIAVADAATPSAPPAEEALLRKLLRRLQPGR